MTADLPHKRSQWQRRLLFFAYITAIGWLCNELAPKPAQTVPFLLGNMAIALLAQRLGFRWGALSLVLVMWPIPDWGLRAFALLHLLLSYGIHKQPWQFWRRLLLMLTMLLPVMVFVAKPDEGSWSLWLLSVLILLLGLLNSELGALLVIRLVDSTRGKPQPFNRLLAIRLTVATAAPLSLAALLALDIYVDREINQSAQRLQVHSKQQAEQVSRHVQQHRVAIASHAASLPPDDLLRQQRALTVLATSFPGFLTLLTTDAEGKIVTAYPPQLSATSRSVADRDYFLIPRHILQPYTSGAFRGRGFGSDPIIAISAPLLDDSNRFRGVLEGSLNLSQLGVILRDEEESRSAHSVLLDSNRKVIVSTLPNFSALDVAPLSDPLLSPTDSVSNNEDDYTRHLNRRHNHLLQISSVPFSAWQLVTLQPYLPLAEAFAMLTVLTILACLTIMAASQLFASSFSHFIAAPLDDLLVRIRELNLDSPDTLHPVETRTSIAELRELTDDFNQLVVRQTSIYGELRASVALLDASNQELEQRVQQRTVELVNARDEANHMASAKSAFLANMSHELRTPLTAIIGFADRALSTPGQGNFANDRDALTIIARNARHLLTLVNDILDASKLEFDKLQFELEPFSPVQMLSDIVSSIQPQAAVKGIDLLWQPQWPLPAQVRGDSTRIKQVLFNIVGNAIKFTERGSVTVVLSADPSGQEWQIEVRDTGIGLSTEQQQRLFQPFMQADASTTRKFGGTGLGLYISRQLILRMGGTFLLQSAAGQGSHFVITLPTQMEAMRWLATAADMPIVTETAPAPERIHLRGTVLLAEDVDDLRTLVAMLVRETGAAVTAVENGQIAVDTALRQDFDLILMDMHMPVRDGMSAVQCLRTNHYRGPIVALTADVLESDVERFRSAGCDQVLAKPIDHQRLLAVLQRYLPIADERSATVMATDTNANTQLNHETDRAGDHGESLASGSEPQQPAASTAASGAAVNAATEISASPNSSARSPGNQPPAAIAALLAQLSQQFLARLPHDVEGLQQELAGEHWEQMQSRLHKLKGAAGTFGYPAISQRADKVYRQLQQQEMDKAKQELQVLLTELRVLLPETPSS